MNVQSVNVAAKVTNLSKHVTCILYILYGAMYGVNTRRNHELITVYTWLHSVTRMYTLIYNNDTLYDREVSWVYGDSFGRSFFFMTSCVVAPAPFRSQSSPRATCTAKKVDFFHPCWTGPSHASSSFFFCNSSSFNFRLGAMAYLQDDMWLAQHCNQGAHIPVAHRDPASPVDNLWHQMRWRQTWECPCGTVHRYPMLQVDWDFPWITISLRSPLTFSYL